MLRPAARAVVLSALIPIVEEAHCGLTGSRPVLPVQALAHGGGGRLSLKEGAQSLPSQPLLEF